jgi:uncharacterized protein
MSSIPKDSLIVLDTNVYISSLFFKSHKLTHIINHCLDSNSICFCDELVVEVLRILNDKFKAKQEDIDFFLKIVEKSHYFALTEIYHLEADPKDGYLLSLSQLAKADYLITGDKKHLLPIKIFGKTKIISPAEFYDTTT